MYECETCCREFCSWHAANQHMKSKGHFKNYCQACGRRFQSENNLRMHLNSSIHRGKNVPCPFCKAHYTSASGLAHHLERGSCPGAPMLNRETILRIIHGRDPQGVITNKQIEWHKEGNSQYSATKHAFNGTSWECYLCHRQFHSAAALDLHLNSPAHKQNVYHCPNVKGKCGKQFTTLAGLFNHLESESCSFIRFEGLQKKVDGIFQSCKAITF
ncbi:putative zinc finger protein [Aspergillus bertholletiae]|uniref:Putative zinc finger protein n=1 Tax=Aspergillus bertholletiae TaxID=1226010 RepID=A0A5N7AXQ5_9EURO|nr:putative zinc finger protein [Aspergillus bertholletiae]